MSHVTPRVVTKTKCARPWKSFKVTPFKYQNVSGRMDRKMLMVVGEGGVIAQIHRPLLRGLSLPAQPPPTAGTAHPALPTDGQESSLGSPASWAPLGSRGDAQGSRGAESQFPLSLLAGASPCWSHDPSSFSWGHCLLIAFTPILVAGSASGVPAHDSGYF